MSKERFSVFATDVETGESRSTTQYLCVACEERRGQMVGYTYLKKGVLGSK